MQPRTAQRVAPRRAQGVPTRPLARGSRRHQETRPPRVGGPCLPPAAESGCSAHSRGCWRAAIRSAESAITEKHGHSTQSTKTRAPDGLSKQREKVLDEKHNAVRRAHTHQCAGPCRSQKRDRKNARGGCQNPITDASHEVIPKEQERPHHTFPSRPGDILDCIAASSVAASTGGTTKSASSPSTVAATVVSPWGGTAADAAEAPPSPSREGTPPPSPSPCRLGRCLSAAAADAASRPAMPTSRRRTISTAVGVPPPPPVPPRPPAAAPAGGWG